MLIVSNTYTILFRLEAICDFLGLFDKTNTATTNRADAKNKRSRGRLKKRTEISNLGSNF
ncbi:hypothetical protein RO3G_03091 [Rhizopus delemar RA 99-880]|uniref:Uncharacterized protein n=1 Tax=Rhizopus delemar (strain RA 99-880 / ATCC MYA-4621 / FGSC 9543 / NRRL 43880) TaxID=246409 RepID=I1BQA7_RHIO9|nr:hypothetical protein RO3G_03091 [Rhizopus delemar RA 99-880]|eukprot:EIE78387.1 hypothetical protein RO3G_03091 [Rhizopus delemar RA 99-880]